MLPPNFPACPPEQSSSAASDPCASDLLPLRVHIDCDACGTANPTSRCERCWCTYYCGPVCEKRHASDHEPDCLSIEDMRLGIRQGRGRSCILGTGGPLGRLVVWDIPRELAVISNHLAVSTCRLLRVPPEMAGVRDRRRSEVDVSILPLAY